MKLMTERVIIIGGGFAGFELAKKRSGNKHFEVIIVDRNNYHFFPPLLYQVSIAFIDPGFRNYPGVFFRTSNREQKFTKGKSCA